MNSDEMTTSPTIETVLDRINQLGQQLRAEIKASTAELIERLGVLTKEVKNTNRKMDVLHKEMLQIRSDQADIEERVEKLEEKLA